jgi:hypothetical protein
MSLQESLNGRSSTQTIAREDQGSCLSEATSKAPGLKSQKITGYQDISQDARRMEHASHPQDSQQIDAERLSTLHGSGREVGSSESTNVTPGFKKNAKEREFPLSSDIGSSDTTHNTKASSGHHTSLDVAALGTPVVVKEGKGHHDNNESVGGENYSGITGIIGSSQESQQSRDKGVTDFMDHRDISGV